MTDTAPALAVEHFRKSFRGLQVTKDVSFQVPRNSITAIIGPNGAGKSTLFNLITNLVTPDAGEAWLFGNSLAGIGAVRMAEMGLIRTFQTARVFPGLTALENVMIGHHRLTRSSVIGSALRLPGSQRAEAEVRDRARLLIEKLRLGAFAQVNAADLPMGSQKLLEIARALMANPRVLLLDEPAAGLNDAETSELAEVLVAIQEAGITVLLVEHNMPLVMSVSDQVIVIDSGTVVSIGRPEEVQADERVIEAYLGKEVAA